MRASMFALTLVAGFLATYCPASLAAVVVTPVTKITIVENGWFGEGLAIHVDSGGVAGCGSPLDFGLISSHPSYRDVLAIALAAQTTGSSVELVVDSGNCVFGGRTYVYSVRLKK